jgi:NADH-quinone oxidoreductase subunit J
MMINTEIGLFVVLALIAAAAAVGVVAFSNPVRSALSLVVNFFVLAFLYFTLQAETLGIIQIVVYTGAIMVLFLFVLMLLNLGAPIAMRERRDPKKLWGVAFGIALFALVSVQVMLPLGGIAAVRAVDHYGAPQVLGRALFTNYVWPFELASVLLLIGLVGSILLAKRRL